MFNRRYAFKKGEPKNLEISWKFNWALVQIFTIRLDREEIIPVENQYEPRKGWEFILQDGSRLKVKLSRFSNQLEVYRNGEPLPGSATDPLFQLAEVYKFIFMWSALLITLGTLKALFGDTQASESGFGLNSILVGGFFLILGFLVRRKSLAALILAMLAFILLGVQSDYHLIKGWSYRPLFDTTFGIIIALFFMLTGFRAILKLKKAPSLKFTHK